MVYYQPDALDRTFAALADPSRRALLTQLEGGEAVSISDLARPLPMSLPAVMKHLDVLSDAGLVSRNKTGRTVMCRLNAAPMQEASRWLERYARYWSEQLDRLAAFLEEDETCLPHQTPHSPPPNPPSPSNVVSMRRPRKSSKPGPTRKK